MSKPTEKLIRVPADTWRLVVEIADAADEVRECMTAPYPESNNAQLQADAALDAAVERLDALLARYTEATDAS